MAQTQAIQALAATGHSNRAISQALGVDRSTVARILSQIQNQPPQWEAPTGSGEAPAGLAGFTEDAPSAQPDVAGTGSTTCDSGASETTASVVSDAAVPASSRSGCESCREEIIRKLEQGLTAQRIWQDLVDEYGFATKYHSVRRYVAKLQKKTPKLVRRSVNRDGHIEVAKAYYSAPPEFVGRDIRVRRDSRLLRLFNERWEQVAVHARTEPGRFSTDQNHIPKKRVSCVERGANAMLKQLAIVGSSVKDWSEAMLQARGVEGIRVLQGLKHLASKHEATALNAACETAMTYGAMRLRTIRKLLQRQSEVRQQQQFDFLEEHPVIRPLSDYSLESLSRFRKDRHP